MRGKIVLLVILIAFTLSCDNSNLKTEVDSSGRVIKKIEYIGNDDYFETLFYENGKVKSEGKVVNKTKTGIWKEYYSDGELRWKGNFHHNILTELLDVNDSIINIVNNPNLLLVGKTYKMRIKIPKEYLKATMLSVDKGKVISSSNKEYYDYLLEPLNEGYMTIYLYFSYEGETNKIATKSIQVSKQTSSSNSWNGGFNFVWGDVAQGQEETLNNGDSSLYAPSSGERKEVSLDKKK